MNDQTTGLPMMSVPSPIESERAVHQARQLFGRTLACWTSDLLSLNRSGRNQLLWRRADSHWTLSRAA